MPDGHSLQGVSILHIITRLDRGGSSDVVLDLAARLGRDGMDVALAYGKTTDPATDIDAFAKRHNIRLYHIPALVRAVDPVRDLVAYGALKRLIRTMQPDIVHTHTSKAGVLGRMAARLFPRCAVVHTPHGHVFYGYFNKYITGLFVRLERYAAKYSDCITLLTDNSLRDHLAAGIGNRDQFSVIHSGLDIERFSSGDASRLRQETGWHHNPIVGWAGRLTEVKNCRAFIDAAREISAKVPDCRFVVAGDGELRQRLEERSALNGLHGSLRFLGNRTDMPDIMAGLDVFVLTSRNEGFGRVLVEAMAAGVPIVATNVGGVSDVVGNSGAGLLVPPGDSQSIARAAISFFRDRNAHDKAAMHGREQAKLFDISHMIHEFEDVYASVLSLAHRRMDGAVRP